MLSLSLSLSLSLCTTPPVSDSDETDP
eukprot:COSAG02_NODE_7504_length_2982_cov_3.081512_4_plen_26_part_01